MGTDIAPLKLGFDADYNGETGTLFSNVGNAFVDLNRQQYVNVGRGGFNPGEDRIRVVGRRAGLAL